MISISKAKWLVALLIVVIVATAGWTYYYSQHNSPQETAKRFLTSLSAKDYASLVTMLDPSSGTINQDTVKAFIDRLDKTPEEMEKIKTALTSHKILNENGNSQRLSSSAYDDVYGFVKHGVGIWNDYKIYAKPGQVKVYGQEGAKIRIKGLGEYTIGSSEMNSVDSVLTGVYEYSTEIKNTEKPGELFANKGVIFVNPGAIVKAGAWPPLAAMKPNCIFYQNEKLSAIDAKLGIWLGTLTFQFSPFPILKMIPPDPKKERIIVITGADKGLPEYLQKNTAYIWRGGKEYVFVKSMEPNEIDSIIEKFKGANNIGVAPYWL